MLHNRIRSMFLYDPEKGAGDPPPTPPTGAGKVEFTAEQQAHINKLLGETRIQGRDSGVSEFLKSLKYEKPEDLQTALAEYAKLRESQMSEQEKAKLALEAAQTRITELEKTTSEMETLKKAKADYETALTAELKKRTEGLQPHLLKLMEKMTPLEQLAYITENTEALFKKSDRIPPTPNPADPKNLTEAEKEKAREQYAQQVRRQY